MCVQCVASSGVYVAGALGALQVLRARAGRARGDDPRTEPDAATEIGVDDAMTAMP